MNTFYKDFKKQAQDSSTDFNEPIITPTTIPMTQTDQALYDTVTTEIAGTVGGLGGAATGVMIGAPAFPLAVTGGIGAATAVGLTKAIKDLYNTWKIKQDVPTYKYVMPAIELFNLNSDEENERLINLFFNAPDDTKNALETAYPGLRDLVEKQQSFERTNTPVMVENKDAKTNKEYPKIRQTKPLTSDDITKNKHDAFVAESLKTLAGAGLGGLAGNYISDAIFDGEYKLPSIIAGALGGGYLGNKW